MFLMFSILLFDVVQADDLVKIKWMYASQGAPILKETAKQFADHMHKVGQGRYQVDILPSDQYVPGKNLNPREILDLVMKGRVQMAVVPATVLHQYSPQLLAMELPYLFENHHQVESVLEGQIGQEMLESLKQNGMRGLAFTYSGGFRIIAGSEKISDGSELSGKKVSIMPNSVAQDVYKLLGAEPTVVKSWTSGRQNVESGVTEFNETTLSHFWDTKDQNIPKVKFVNETNHSLFLTVVVINEKYFNSLTRDQQKFLKTETMKVARHERQVIIDKDFATRKRLNEAGIPVLEPTVQLKENLRKTLDPLYTKYRVQIGKNFVDKLIKASRQDSKKIRLRRANLYEIDFFVLQLFY